MHRSAITVTALLLLAGSPFSAIAQPKDGDAATKEKPKSAPMIQMGGMKPGAKAKERAEIDPAEGKAEAALKLDVLMYDFKGTKEHNRMYMPSSAKLTSEKPEGVTKEPTYQGTAKYASVTVGNGTPSHFAIALDEAEGKEPKIYVDLNGDGDLTNDGTGEWQTRSEGKEGGPANYQSTWTFKPGYKGADGSSVRGDYALNFYWQPGREQLNYYNASARTGTITLGGKKYDVTLIENDADGVFNKLANPSEPMVVGEAPSKPVWLLLDGDQFDIRGTFGFAGLNYLASVSDDGSKLTMTPTVRCVHVPRMQTEQVTMRPAGGPAPDFEAIAWKPGQKTLDATQRFKLSDFKGKKIVVLDMWATWCGPCMKGIPHMSKIAEATADQDVVVIALNSYDDEKPFVGFANGKGKDYKFMLARDPAGRDSNSAIAKKLFGVSGIPATYIIDKTGKIAGVVSGYSEGDTKVEQYLKGLGVKID